MRAYILALALLCSTVIFAQTAQSLTEEGIALHDKGEYDAALKKYDEALALDPKYTLALYEKALTYTTQKKNKDCIEVCEKLIDQGGTDDLLRKTYVTWASALDDLGKTKEAHKIYDRGLKKFPQYYLLHFNKGLTYMRQKEWDSALACYEAALLDNPFHPSSLYYSAAILAETNKIPSLLSFMQYLVADPSSQRSATASKSVEKTFFAEVKKEGNNITVNIPLNLNKNSQKNKENDFYMQEFILGLLPATAHTGKFDSIATTKAAGLDLRLQSFISSLASGAKEGRGFYWEHHAPFFAKLKEEGYTLVLANLIMMSTDTVSQVWIETKKEKVDKFYDWVKGYRW